MKRMFRVPLLRAVLPALLAAAAGTVRAAEPPSAEDALRAAERWRERSARPFGRAAGLPTGRTRTFSEDGTNLFHLVEFQGGGFAAVSAGGAEARVMAVAPSGELPAADDGGPFWALLAGDGAAAAGRPPRRRANRPRLSAEDRFAAPSGRRSAEAADRGGAKGGVGAVSDVRVAPLVETRWDQEDVAGRPLYNLHTPEHWCCGCVATALAQVMRFHRWPAAAVAPQTIGCWTNGVAVNLTLLGGAYDWDAMPADPGPSVSDAEREAIGRLCFDAGVSVRMHYAPDGAATIGTFSFEPLKTIFGYASAEGYIPSGSLSAAEIRKSILANLDAGCPVVLAIAASGSGGRDAGHSIVADGYGYEDGTLWCHLNLGWSGAYDLWYALPDIPAGNYAFSVVDGVVYNVFPEETGDLVTGRVTDPGGRPLAGATVTAAIRYAKTTSWGTTWKDGGTVTATTSANGIYAIHALAGKTCSVTLSATYGASSSSNAVASTEASVSPSNLQWGSGYYYLPSSGLAIGNSWGNDLVVEPVPGARPAIAVFEPAEGAGGESGFELSFGGTPGAEYGVEFRPSLSDGSWAAVTNLLLPPGGVASLFLPAGDGDTGFWRVVPGSR